MSAAGLDLAALTTFVGVILYLWSERAGHGRLRAAGKCAAALGFLCGGLIGSRGALGPASAALVAGLAFSVVGDILLLSRKRTFFAAGLGAFLLAHIAYTYGLVLIRPPDTPMSPASVAPIAAGVGAWFWLRPHLPKSLRAAVLVYIAAITAMVACALELYAATGSGWLCAGAIVFAVSDLAVARDRFIAQGFSNRMVGAPLYFCAQWLFVIGICEIGQ